MCNGYTKPSPTTTKPPIPGPPKISAACGTIFNTPKSFKTYTKECMSNIWAIDCFIIINIIDK